MTMATDTMPLELQLTLSLSAKQNAPMEVCGFVMSDWYLVFLPNIATESGNFRIADEVLLQFYTEFPQPLGLFHTHPGGRPEPSRTDIDHAPQGLRYWIATPDDVYEWDMSRDTPVLLP